MDDISVASYTEKGLGYINEDYILTERIDNSYYFAVADGIRSYSNGEIAAETACKKAIEQMQDYKTRNGYKDILDSVNEKMFRSCMEQGSKAGCSICLLHIEDNNVFRSHVGDCRIYHFDNGRVADITKDHSIAGLCARRGYISVEDIRTHRYRRKLTSALGIFESIPQCDEEVILPLKTGQQFILCTNGFWELINEREMEESLKNACNAQEWLDNMLTYINKHRDVDRDNLSVVTIWVGSV